MRTEISEAARRQILKMQQGELNESYIYEALAKREKNEENKKILMRLSAEERAHYEIWKEYTDTSLKPQKGKILWCKILATVLGVTFTIKKMENGEESAQTAYELLEREIPESKDIRHQEEEHEAALVQMIDEERLKYVGSMVLGLNDALVELTGTLAGLTLAMRDTRLVALSGLITGISATFSMASSEYLSAKSDGEEDALKSCVYTGIAYLITVALLVLPYLLFPSSGYMMALATMLVIVIAIIFFFNYYISVAKDYNFKRRFGEMACVSLGVALLSFVIGILVKQFLGVEI